MEKEKFYIVYLLSNGCMVQTFPCYEDAWTFINDQINPGDYYMQKAWKIVPQNLLEI